MSRLQGTHVVNRGVRGGATLSFEIWRQELYLIGMPRDRYLHLRVASLQQNHLSAVARLSHTESKLGSHVSLH
jgi:hypothetical protein